MVWQAFIDESERNDNQSDYFVIGGCISTSDRWANFAKEWNELLPRFGRVDSKGRYFHMTEMPSMHDVAAFYRVMERNIPVYISARFRKSDFRNAISRIYTSNAISEWDINYYFTAFRCLMDKFHLERNNDTIKKVIPVNERVEFIFDQNSNESIINKCWDEYLDNRDIAVRDFYADNVRFEDDRLCLPLQAADFWAWWVRHWAENDQKDRILVHEFGDFGKKSGFEKLIIDISFDEEQFIPTLKRMAQRQLSWYREVIVLPPGPQLYQASGVVRARFDNFIICRLFIDALPQG
jgi:hypothetical protein